ncbi:7693_t:CDS:2 [Funneliformis geosporum]|uniref:13806_t:CDS:1 n=1 Tax=Funneliformis geosporum TaxID=1117311 RepID=A0A9W4WVU3_9GLOM|nr:7693_t:CDS:2 [Funneliformis geosporum]CAI2167396.1 13806_t:CDS:2 [Funneliformis geosporum]
MSSMSQYVKLENTESSAQHIRDLEGIEKMIVELMDTAAKSIMSLVLDGHTNNNDEKTETMANRLGPEQRIESFQALTKQFSEVNHVILALLTFKKIQVDLRYKFRQMRNMGITSGDIPIRTVTYGEAKEYETWMNAAKILRKELEKIVEIGTVAGGLQDMKNDNMEIDEPYR